MPRITEMYAFVTQEGDDPNNEGILGFQDPRTKQWFPMVGADMDRVSSLTPIADDICAQAGKTYKILRFQLVSEITRRSKPEIGG